MAPDQGKQKQKQDPTPSKRRRAAYISLGVLCAVITMAFFVIKTWFVHGISNVAVRKEQEDQHFYPDLSSGSGYACSEVNNFVNEFDPFYRWALRSSLPTILQQSIGSISPDVLENANAAYQQSSAWRVISSWKDSSNASKLYVSSDPHILGGEFKQHRHNWIWRMKTTWGISMRMCLSYGNDGYNRSCLWTTPIIATEEGDLAFLYIGIPYRAPSIDTPTLANAVYSNNGLYLSNYASNARTDFSTRQKLKDQYYLTSGIQHCKLAPFYYDSDAVSYLAFPALQCGCNGSVCIVATRNIKATDWGLISFNASCNGLKSYWAWNAGDWDSFTLVAHNSSSNSLVPFLVTFDSWLGSDLSSLHEDDLLRMQNLTTCVETAMALAPVPPPYELEKRCAINLTLSIQSGKQTIGKLQSSRVWFSDPQREEKEPTCANDLPLGQLRFKDNVCLSKLDPSISSQLRLKIKSLVEVTDIRFKQNKAWKNLAESRHSVYLAMFTGVVSVLGSCAAVISHRLMDIEKDLEKKMQDYRKSESRWKRIIGVALNWLGNHWIKFLYRASLLVASAFSALFAVYDGTMGGIKDRNLVQAQTVTMSMSQGTTVLVTTTATSEVSPVWTSFVVFSVFTCLVIIGSLYWVGHMLDTIVGISDEDSTRRSQGGSSRICPEEMDEIIASQKP